MAVSPLDMLQEEVDGFLTAQLALLECMELIGTEEDGEALRAEMHTLKQALAVAESSISNRLKSDEVADLDPERHGALEDEFFELKARYFSQLRECLQAEATPIPVAQPLPPARPVAMSGSVGGIALDKPPVPSRGAQPFPPDQESGWASSPPPRPQQQQQQQQLQVERPDEFAVDGIQLTQRDSVYWNARELVERDEEMQFISSEMVHLRDAFQDMATEVDVQTEQQEEVEEHVEQARENAKQGVETLGKSAKNSKRVLLPGVGGGIGGVAGGVAGSILGTFAGGMTVPGAVVGAALGASAGASVGHGVGKIIRKGNDKDAAKSRLLENWQPDSSTKNCTQCQKKFSQMNRRHHCRNCGQIFCAKCSKHRMHIPGVDSDSRPRVCTQCFEALMYHAQGIKPPNWRQTQGLEEGGSPVPGSPLLEGPGGDTPPPIPGRSSVPMGTPPVPRRP